VKDRDASVKVVSKNKVIYCFSPTDRPAIRVRPGEFVLLKTEDAFGGQVKGEKEPLGVLDWSRVDAATGPVFVETAKPGDTLVTEILDISIEKKGVIAAFPKSGILAGKKFKPSTKVVKLVDERISFDGDVWISANPMIGTIGVAPKRKVATGTLGKHGGNMDVKELTAGTRLYLPVLTEGALFAAGDLHAVQADGELCVSAIEVAGEILLRFSLIRGKKPEWPILETKDSFAFLACGNTLDEAAKLATETMVKALMREYDWPFEHAYMFGSLAIDLQINQVVDPKKGVRATVSKDFVTLKSLLT
jgi:amidase